jgi:hypothetical protein
MAEHVERNRPVRPRPIDQMKGAATLPSSDSTTFMAAQKEVMKSIEESANKLKAERERSFETGVTARIKFETRPICKARLSSQIWIRRGSATIVYKSSMML